MMALRIPLDCFGLNFSRLFVDDVKNKMFWSLPKPMKAKYSLYKLFLIIFFKIIPQSAEINLQVEESESDDEDPY